MKQVQQPEPVKYRGRVMRGDGYGRKLGFPTANLDRRQWTRQKLKLKHGVYAGTAVLESGKQYPTGIVIGPLDAGGKLPKIEAYLIGFKGSLYGHKLILQIGKFIRPYKKFGSEKALKLQIQKDVTRVIKLKP